MKLPYIQFYTGDWKKDPRLSLCSPATRGIWIDLICSLHDDQIYAITGTSAQLARVCRCNSVEMDNAISELRITQTADITQRDEFITITCRRMKKQFELSQVRSTAAKQRHSKVPAKPVQTPMQSSEYEDDFDGGSESSSGEGVQGKPNRLHGIPNSVDEVIAAGKSLYPPKDEQVCRQFWAHYEGQKRTNPNGQIFWITSGERVVTDWKVKLSAFEGKTINEKRSTSVGSGNKDHAGDHRQTAAERRNSQIYQ